jgi:prepilin-type N-terminal cleavage/methylation domain-containing protein
VEVIKKRGFTLLETSVVLGLMTIILVIGWDVNLGFSQKYQEDQFWQAFRQNWSYMILKGRQEHERSRACFFPKYVLFKINMTEQIIRLEYPKTMKLVGGQCDETVSSSGVAQAQTVRISSTLPVKYYDVKFQVGYGGQYDLQKGE